MPIPNKQLQQLQSGLKQHQERLLLLRSKMTDMEQEMNAHEAVLNMGQNTALLAAVDELYDQPQLGQVMATNPTDYFAKKGITPPQGATWNATVNDPDTAVEAHFNQGSVKFKIRWDRTAGFSLSQIG